jgi:hypothetical protein
MTLTLDIIEKGYSRISAGRRQVGQPVLAPREERMPPEEFEQLADALAKHPTTGKMLDSAVHELTYHLQPSEDLLYSMFMNGFLLARAIYGYPESGRGRNDTQ